MSRTARRSTVLAFAVLTGCLLPPPLAPRPDAGARDAGPDARLTRFSVVSVKVRDARGTTWEEGAPRSPSIVIRFSDPPLTADGCLLLSGAPDPDLIADLSASPLRESTIARQIAVRTSVADATVTLVPEEPIAPGTSFVVAIPAWLARTDGLRLGAAFTLERVVSSDPAAGASATDAWPPDGAFGVPTSLAMAALRFDGDVPDVARAILLRDAAGRSVAGRTEPAACTDVGWPSGTCVTLRPTDSLASSTAYELAVRDGTLDATGAPVPPTTARFVTGSSASAPPIEAVDVSCTRDEESLDGACVRADDESVSLRLALSGAARVTWQAGAHLGSSVAPRGDVTILLGDLRPASPITLTVVATDYREVETASSFDVATTEPLPTIAITEVRADPAGAEPRQEYIELLNYAREATDLSGLFLSDSDAEGDALPSFSVAAGARVLLVTDDFDPDDDASGADATVPAGTPLVRVDGTLASGGLSNSGEPLFLRDAMRRRVSSVPASPPPIEGGCVVRTSTSMRAGEPGTFEYAPLGTCTPGR
jgi:hypothetical protein